MVSNNKARNGFFFNFCFHSTSSALLLSVDLMEFALSKLNEESLLKCIHNFDIQLFQAYLNASSRVKMCQCKFDTTNAMFQRKRMLKSFIFTFAQQQKCGLAAILNVWICWEGHCTIREPGERIADAVWSAEQPRRPKRSVAEHKTLAGMCSWMAAWREGPADPSSRLCQPLNFEFDTSSHWFEQWDEYISPVCGSGLRWQKCGIFKLSCNGNMRVYKAGDYLRAEKCLNIVRLGFVLEFWVIDLC